MDKNCFTSGAQHNQRQVIKHTKRWFPKCSRAIYKYLKKVKQHMFPSKPLRPSA